MGFGFGTLVCTTILWAENGFGGFSWIRLSFWNGVIKRMYVLKEESLRTMTSKTLLLLKDRDEILQFI